MKAPKVFILVLVLALLVTLGEAAGAQGPRPSEGGSSSALTLLNSGCGSGSSYDPWCDVNHSNKIDVIDVQLVASKWGRSGTYIESYWSLTGNAGTTPGANFLGTTDNQAFELHVNDTRALRLEPNATSPNFVGGHWGNGVTAGAYGATIGGGGETGNTNRVTDNYGMVGGGADNQAGNNNGTTDDAEYATVGGGRVNSAGGKDATIGGGAYISVTGQAATVAGGSWITVTADYAAVGGGYQNVVAGTYAAVSGGLSNTASSDVATVGGGWGNTASAWYATVGGGAGNTASSAVATVGGGWLNTASDWYATVGGGAGNTASSDYATVGGGYFNRAAAITATIGGGSYISVTGQAATVAGGSRITVTGNYAAVGGGVANTAGGSYATIPGGAGNSANGIGSFAAGENATAGHDGSFVWSSAEGTSSWGNNTFTVRAHGGVRFYSASGTGTGVQLYHGGTSWGSISDRRVKENFSDVDSARLLETLEAMPIQTWNLKAQSPAMRHIGPVAQDFNGMFSYLFEEVESPTHINNMDAIGVSLAAAQGLYELSQVQATRIQTLEAENMAQQKQIDDLKARLAALEQTVKNTPAQHINLPVPGWLFTGLLLTGLVQGQRRRARRGP